LPNSWILGDRESAMPSFAELFDRLQRNFTGLGLPKAERLEPLSFDLVLSPEEAQRGGMLPLEVPAVADARSAGGPGYDWAFPCSGCAGSGWVERRRLLRIMLPPRVPSGVVFERELDDLGIDKLFLRLRVLVAG
jgi:hypothetical protein